MNSNHTAMAGMLERSAKVAESCGDLQAAHDLYVRAAELFSTKDAKRRNEDAAKRIAAIVTK